MRSNDAREILGMGVATLIVLRSAADMRVWIDQDLCTGDGLCTDHCPELFVLLDDGISYVRDQATPARRQRSRRPGLSGGGAAQVRVERDRRRPGLPG